MFFNNDDVGKHHKAMLKNKQRLVIKLARKNKRFCSGASKLTNNIRKSSQIGEQMTKYVTNKLKKSTIVT